MASITSTTELHNTQLEPHQLYWNNKQTEDANNPSSFPLTLSKDDMPLLYGKRIKLTILPNWILDSGATNHFATEACPLSSRTTTNGGIARLGKGHAIICGTGTLNTMWGEITTTINNIHILQDFKRNILSTSQLLRDGYHVTSNDRLTTIHHQGRLILVSILSKATQLMEVFHYPHNPIEVNTTAKESEHSLWHCRLGHVNINKLNMIIHNGLVKNMNLNNTGTLLPCEPCLLGKMTRKSFSASQPRSQRILELIHTDISGPITPVALGEFAYFITFIDDFTRFVTVYLMRKKSEAFFFFTKYHNESTTRHGCKIARLMSDEGSEYKSQSMLNFLLKEGIESLQSIPYTPEQNGIAERTNRSLVDIARTYMTSQPDIPSTLWGEAIVHASMIKNILPTSPLGDTTTPYIMWYGSPPDVSQLITFGATVFAYIQPQQRTQHEDTPSKFTARAEKGLFTGYARGKVGGFRVYSLIKEDITLTTKIKCLQETHTHSPLPTTMTFNVANKITLTPAPQVPDTDNYTIPGATDYSTTALPTAPPSKRPKRTTTQPTRLGFEINTTVTDTNTVHDSLSDINTDDMTYSEAMSSRYKAEWQSAMDAEMKGLWENETFTLCTLPPNRKAITCRFTYKIKLNEHGEIDRFKARLCARGFQEIQGIDYNETFAPVARISTVRFMLAHSAHHNMSVHQMDVQQAFLHAKLDEEIYMTQPKGYIQRGKENLVFRLLKSLYGLKQAPRAWNNLLHTYLIKIGFKQADADPCLYTWRQNNNFMWTLIWVDDFITAATDPTILAELKSKLCARFHMKDLGPIHYFLGIQIKQDTHSHTLSLSQTKYTQEILVRFNMAECNGADTPCNPSVTLSRAMEHKEPSNPYQEHYRKAVGCLQYLTQCTRPDIAYAVNQVSKYFNNPGKAHWTAVKRILEYLRNTQNHGIRYQSTTNKELKVTGFTKELEVTGFADADFANDPDTRVSTTGYIFMINDQPVTWKSKKQACVTKSTTEAEYVALSTAAAEAVWIQKLITDIGPKSSDKPRPIKIYEDNAGAIRVTKNPEGHERTKHIDIHYHFIRDRYRRNEIEPIHISTENQVADIMTKGSFTTTKFTRLRDMLSINNIEK